jgi:hypothetical protein
MKSFDFLRIKLREVMPFRRIIRGKSEISTDYTARRYAFIQYNLRKVLDFCRLSCGKAGLFTIQFAESFDFPWNIRGKFPSFHEYLTQMKTKFENIFRHSSGAYEVLIHNKNRAQKSQDTVPLSSFRRENHKNLSTIL